MRKLLRPRLPMLLLLLALLWAGPLFAYVIYLTDGSAIQAKEKYKVVGERALITLPNGNQTFLPMKKIDAARTEQANVNDYGTAVVIGDSRQPVPPAAALPPQQSLTDLIHDKAPEPRQLPPARRTKPGTTPTTPTASPSTLLRTKAGYADLSSLARKPYSQIDVTAELQQFFHGQGVEEVEVYQGTQGDRPLVEVTTNSEGAVFRALGVASTALIHVRERHPKVTAFELLLMTPGRDRAGQFVLTPQMAADIVSRNVEVSAFYLSNVQF
jgi:hypothetical protein